MFLFTFMSQSKIKNNENKKLQERYGSLFSEFKNDRGYFSSLYYSIFFLRRLAYLISQVYLNSFLFLQSSINIGFSAIQTIHLLYYRPFKQTDLFVSSLVGEVSSLVVLSLSAFFTRDISSELSSILETTIIYTIIGSIGIQFIISLYSLFKALKKLLGKILKYRSLNFLRSYNHRVEMTITESNMTTNQSSAQVINFNQKSLDLEIKSNF
jgi:hypothetical protein